MMKKISRIKCNEYRKIKNPKISCILNKTLVLSIICDKCGNNKEKIFEE